ncbi:SDR family NAD(P)-dependent oxidoreductase [Nonomuraea zeae]|uniref:SDR family NAD(P)-dependent oxidoreductase n=1 Tax=Nonomuraea zeae TaxID=1642303 RepID=A0A5S4G4W0_9ACTN|nr:SDR family NAD(P)-dependent oxidoreductase [Nonomuraea zeae]TMR28045.1 SDR family NAD(P)-dependent oxidoreductase [Nonomuraea zeae]
MPDITATTGKIVLTAGANNGIGRALLEEVLRRGAQQVYAASREAVTQAFLPHLTRSRGAIVNHLSVAAFAPLSIVPAYSISKAAAFSLTQSQRALLADHGVRVHAVFIGPTDTDMSRELDAPKASPASVARAVFDGVKNQEEDIFPDSMSQTMAAGWRGSPAKTLELEYAALVASPAREMPAVTTER